MRASIMTFALGLALGACKQTGTEQKAPAMSPEPPRQAATPVRPAAAPVERRRATEKVPEKTAFFVELSREGFRLEADTTVDGKLSRIVGDELTVDGEGKPLRILLRAPLQLRPALREGDALRVAYQTRVEPTGRDEALRLRTESASFESVNRHAGAPIQETFLDGKLIAKQTVEGEGVELGELIKRPVAVEVTWGTATKSLQAGEQVDLTQGRTRIRVWVVSSLHVTDKKGAPPLEGEPYQLMMVVTTGAPQ